MLYVIQVVMCSCVPLHFLLSLNGMLLKACKESTVDMPSFCEELTLPVLLQSVVNS